MEASAVSFLGTNIGAMKDEVAKKVDMYVNMLLQSANECESKKVMDVYITMDIPMLNNLCITSASKEVVNRRYFIWQFQWKYLQNHSDFVG